jgi:hypothetical protein
MHARTIIQLITAVGVGSLITTILNLWWGWWSKRSENKRSAAYLAIRLAVILERFAIECADVVTEQEEFEQGRGESASALPALEGFPSEQGWNTLDPALSARVLTFPNTLRL